MSGLALITGGQRGIGRAIAEALVTAGWRVALVAECAKDHPDVVQSLDRLGDRARFFTHDLLQIADAAALLDRIEAGMGPVSCFVSNAGVPARTRGDMLDLAPESFDFVLGVNLRGAFFLAQDVARRMLETPGDAYRSMAFVTSVSAQMVSVERAEYCLSKSAASMMAKLFAQRLAADDIGVFELRPGIIDTDMTAGVKDAYTARIEDGLVPARRWGLPSDVGSVMVPLASGQMRFATGSVIAIDGGLSIPRL